jgi:long-chain acyl-CoA synthetase
MPESRPWHAHYPAGVAAWPEFETITLSKALQRTTERFPDQTALYYMGKKISYRELNRRVGRFAAVLQKLGVGVGDKVAMLLPNIPQMVVANFAVWRLGAVTAPNNPLYTERELAHQLNDSQATILVALDLLMPRVRKVLPQTAIRDVIVCHLNDDLPFPKNILFPLVKRDMYRAVVPEERLHLFADLIRAVDREVAEDRSEWNSLAALLYTGGTTGVSKGVMLTHGNLSSNVQQVKMWFYDLQDGEGSMLAVFPFFHAAGFTAIQCSCVFSGLTNVLVPRPEPGVIIDIMKKAKPQFVPGVPTIYVGLLNNPLFRRLDHRHVRAFTAGAAPLPLETIQDLKGLTGKGIVNVYGLTESSAMATATPVTGIDHPQTVGLPLPATDIKIVDIEDGTTEMPADEPGEVVIKGPQIMQGYYNRPEATDAVLQDGWLHTGDIGRMDEEGFLTLVDRKKDMIIASGYNVYPTEIDGILYDHPDVLEACTIGVPDAYRGETVKVFVVPKQGASLSKEDLIVFCRERLAAYKVPRQVAFIDELPKSAVGKILRRKLREREGAAGENKGVTNEGER